MPNRFGRRVGPPAPGSIKDFLEKDEDYNILIYLLSIFNITFVKYNYNLKY